MIFPNPASRGVLPDGHVDLAVVGAGAAGISAAREATARGLSIALIEARPWIGGRAVTASFGGHPIDLGAHWLHAGELNPLVPLARARGEPLRRAPGSGAVVVDGHFVPSADRQVLGQAFDRADLAFARAAKAPDDGPLSKAMPPLGRWGGAIASTMTLVSGRPLHEVSVKDFPSDEFGDNYFVRGGYGAYLAKLAHGLPLLTGCPVLRVDWSGAGVVLETGLGRVAARAAVVTVPMAVLNAGTVRFAPELPAEIADAAAAFLPGTYEHVILNWTGSPFRGADRLVKILSHGRSHGLMTNMDGAPFHYFELDHRTATDLPGRQDRARYARAVLAESFGGRAIERLRVLHVTDWNADQWSRCAWAVVPPGRVGARKALGRPVGERIWFAGEANSDGLWGTVGGAWAEGRRAAGEVADQLGR